MAQYVSCKGHKPSCQGYRLAEIFSIFVYTPGKPGRGSEDAACAVSGFDSRVSLLTATYGLLKIQPSAACGTFHWTKITITARITAACVGVRTIGAQGLLLSYLSINRRLRNAKSRINTAFFVTEKQITPHRIWYNRVAKN